MTTLPSFTIEPATLASRSATRFDLTPDAEARAALARALEISGLKRMRFKGALTPKGKSDWELRADLGATAVQPCVVTLDPVTTRIDQPVHRVYIANWQDPEAHEVEMPEDTDAEPLPATLDLYAVLLEALDLALPSFPRAEGANLGAAHYTEEGVAPMTDEDVKPFAGLAALKDKLTPPE